jgi:hypothetical protein
VAENHLTETIDPHFLRQHTLLLCHSYFDWTGRRLLDADPSAPETAQGLFEADFTVLSHDTQNDPVFNYANRCAMHIFGMNWQEITQLPSHHSAEPMLQDERAGFLERVAQHGFVDDYSGIRIAKDGQRFMIVNATVWNLVDIHGSFCGQAAMIPQWYAM